MNKELFTGYWQHFNQRANLYLYGPDREKIAEQIIEEASKTWRLTQYVAGGLTLYTFGIMMTNPKDRPGHGGEWSSNSESINQKFGCNIKEIAYNGISCAIDVHDAEALAPAGVVYVGLKNGFHTFEMNQTERLDKIDLNGKLIKPKENFPHPIIGYDPKHSV